jgi:hypothetical protein
MFVKIPGGGGNNIDAAAAAVAPCIHADVVGDSRSIPASAAASDGGGGMSTLALSPASAPATADS